MNERKFLKELNSKVNKDGDLTPSLVGELIQQGRRLQVAKKENIFARLFRRNRRVKTVRQIVEDNIKAILGKTADNQLDVLLEVLIANDETLEIVVNRFDEIIERLQKPQSIQKDDELQDVRSKFLWRFKKKEDTKVILIEHMDSILQGTITIEDAGILKGLSEEIDKKLNEKLESEKEMVARELLGNISFSGKIENEKRQLIEDYVPTVTRVQEELLADQNVRMIDIRRIGRGGYSKVYQIGEKVLKIGKPRETYKIPNHPRILQPLTRTNLIDERDNKIFGCLEISDRTDKLWSGEDLQVEKLYQLYKELRDDGIIWTDARFSNVGKLRRRNIPKLNGEEMDVDPVAVGMDKEAGKRILEAGDWVIIDTDFIYKQEDGPAIIWIENSYSEGFERRWNQERQGEVVAKYQKEETAREKSDYTKSYELRSWEKEQEEER